MLRFHVEGMTCGHCVQAITQAVKAVDPNAEVDVNLGEKSVRVVSAFGEIPIAEAIRQAGYATVAA